MLKDVPCFMLIKTILPEKWAERVCNLLWKGYPVKSCDLKIVASDLKSKILVCLGDYKYSSIVGDDFYNITPKVLRILWKSGIPLEATMSRDFSAKELLPLLDKFEFVITPALGNLIKKWSSENVSLYTITIIKDEDISLKLEVPKVHSYSAKPRSMRNMLEFFRELYMWHPCDISSTSSSNVESWVMPTFI